MDTAHSVEIRSLWNTPADPHRDLGGSAAAISESESIRIATEIMNDPRVQAEMAAMLEPFETELSPDVYWQQLGG